MNVVTLLDAGAPDAVAIVDASAPGRTGIRCREFGARVSALTARLRASGVAPGDRVLVAVPISIDTYVTLLATLAAGGVAMFVDPGQSAGALLRCLRAAPPVAVAGTRSMLRIARWLPGLARVPVRLAVDERGDAADGECRPLPRSDADPALLTFTSGSTGTPKPVVRTHGFLVRQLEALEPVTDSRPGDVEFTGMPMFVLQNLARGVTSVIDRESVSRPGRVDPVRLRALLLETRVNRVLASPALLARLAEHCLAAGRRLPLLERISTGGGPVPPGLPERLRRVAPGARVQLVYGSSEAEPVAAIEAADIGERDRRAMEEGAGLLAGRPVSGCDVRIAATDRATPPADPVEVEANWRPAGEIGEIVVRGRHVRYGRGDAVVDHGRRRWHRTGDAGWLDQAGRLWLVGRIAGAVDTAAGRVYPFQVETPAQALPGVERAALACVDGRPTLFVALRPGLAAPPSRALAGCLARHGIERILTVRRLPLDRRHNAKLDYAALERRSQGRLHALRARLAAGLVRAARRSAVALRIRLGRRRSRA